MTMFSLSVDQTLAFNLLNVIDSSPFRLTETFDITVRFNIYPSRAVGIATATDNTSNIVSHDNTTFQTFNHDRRT